VEEIDRETRAKIEEEIKAALEPIMAQYNVSMTLKVWSADKNKRSKVILFKR
jgi:hypothetical protein